MKWKYLLKICVCLSVLCGFYIKAERFASLASVSTQQFWYEKGVGHLNEVSAKNSQASTFFYNNAILDHGGDLSNPQFWQQRYYIDDSFWEGNDFPIFLYVGGEGPLGPPTKALFMYELAEKHKALVVALEHRFYGVSQPTPDMSATSLRYLTSQQALADLGAFVEYLKGVKPMSGDTRSSPPLDLKYAAKYSKVIVFGGSYPGNLAAWFKLKYPDHAIGSISSSAPVYAENDFQQYAQVVTNSLSMENVGGSEECRLAVRNATAMLHDLAISTHPYASSPDMPDYLRSCSKMEKSEDFVMYLSEIFSLFQG